MLQVQVLVQENGNFIEAEFKKIKVTAFTSDILAEAYPYLGDIVINTSGVVIVEQQDRKIIFVKQAYVK